MSSPSAASAAKNGLGTAHRSPTISSSAPSAASAAKNGLVLGLVGLAGLTIALLACGNDDQPSLNTFCERLEAAFNPEGALAGDYSNNATEARAVTAELEGIRRVAPLEIEPSLAAVNEVVELIIASFSDPSRTQIDPQTLQDSEVAAAELNSYSMQHCALELRWQNPVLLLDPDRIPGEVSLEVRG